MDLRTWQMATPAIIVGVAVSFLWLEKRYPYNFGRRALRPGFWTDLVGYGVFQSYVLGLLISEIIHAVNGLAGLSRYGLVASWPLWVQALFFIVSHDLVTYAIHRAQHASPRLWRFHEAHHSCRDVDWLSGLRSHSVEICLYQTAEYLPVVLLGADPRIPLIKAVANASYGMFIHANLDVRLGPFEWILNGPKHHRWHHANDRVEAYGHNLATKFLLWDRLFGTLYEPHEARAREFGPDDPEYPEGYFAQHWYAIKKLALQRRSL